MKLGSDQPNNEIRLRSAKQQCASWHSTKDVAEEIWTTSKPRWSFRHSGTTPITADAQEFSRQSRIHSHILNPGVWEVCCTVSKGRGRSQLVAIIHIFALHTLPGTVLQWRRQYWLPQWFHPICHQCWRHSRCRHHQSDCTSAGRKWWSVTKNCENHEIHM